MSENEDKTRIVRPLDQLQRAGSPDPNDSINTRQLERGDTTVKTSEGGIGSRSQPSEESKTVLFRPSPNRPAHSTTFNPLGARAEPQDASNDPVVGWLVLVKGPGLGNAVRLGYGWNSIGRDASQRVRLDFGDSQISRLNHAKLLYDPRSRKFTITLGDGTNPTYIRGEALLVPTELKSGDRVQIGETELMFIGLCGETFDWQDNA